MRNNLLHRQMSNSLPRIAWYLPMQANDVCTVLLTKCVNHIMDARCHTMPFFIKIMQNLRYYLV
jgi:hypothetical protein